MSTAPHTDVETPSRREQTKQANRARLYDAALELFAEHGYSQVSVEQICERADVGRATFFRLFGSKGGLLVEFNRRLATEARARVEALGPDAGAAAALAEVQHCLCDAWLSAGAGLREVAREYIQTVSLAAGTRTRSSQPDLHALVSGIVRDGQARGEVVASPTADFVAWVVVASLSSAIATWLGTPETLRRRSEETLQLLFGGLLAS